jgi:hypothetical protein
MNKLPPDKSLMKLRGMNYSQAIMSALNHSAHAPTTNPHKILQVHKDSKNPIGKKLRNLDNCNQWFLLIDLVKVEVKVGASSL